MQSEGCRKVHVPTYNTNIVQARAAALLGDFGGPVGQQLFIRVLTSVSSKSMRMCSNSRSNASGLSSNTGATIPPCI